MAAIKTAISMDKTLFHRVERARKQMKLSRSAWLARAAGAYLAAEEDQRLLEQLKKVYGSGEMDEETRLFVEASTAQLRRATKDDKW